jgi:hypothetical protein
MSIAVSIRSKHAFCAADPERSAFPQSASVPFNIADTLIYLHFEGQPISFMRNKYIEAPLQHGKLPASV